MSSQHAGRLFLLTTPDECIVSGTSGSSFDTVGGLLYTNVLSHHGAQTQRSAYICGSVRYLCSNSLKLVVQDDRAEPDTGNALCLSS
jgi:hypothetical protein